MNKLGIAWSWQDALFASIIVLPAAGFIAFGNPEVGLPLLLGSLPAAVIGLSPMRKQRLRIALVGILFAVSMLIGSALAVWPVVAVLALLGAGYGSAQLAARKPVGLMTMTLCVPLIGVGFSYPGIENALGIAAILAIGSIWATIISMLFPERPAEKQAEQQLLPASIAKSYGLRYGLAGATAASLGFLLGVEHVGWITGAALFIFRPMEATLKSRAWWRVGSVTAGALLAALLLTASLPQVLVAVIASLAIVLAGATHASRSYVTPFFSTFIVFWVLLYASPTEAAVQYRFDERVLETALGVAIGAFFGLMLPHLLRRRA